MEYPVRAGTASWQTLEAMTMVRDMALANQSNAEIAYQVTNRFGTFVSSSAIAGAVHRMKLPARVWRVTKRTEPRPAPVALPAESQFGWHVGPKPEWGTYTADLFVQEAKRRFVSTTNIGRYFGVDPKTVDAAMRRCREVERALKETDYTGDVVALLPFATDHWPLSVVIKLVVEYLRGDTEAELAEALQRSKFAIHGKAKRLQHAGILPARVSATAESAGDRRKRLANRPARKPRSDDLSSADHGVWSRTPASNLRYPVGLVTEKKVPLCAWSGCKRPADGKWCADHGALLRAPASDISRELHTWR